MTGYGPVSGWEFRRYGDVSISVEGVVSDKERIDQLEQLVRSFVLETLDYARINKLGDAEQQHNVRWARKLGIKDKLP